MKNIFISFSTFLVIVIIAGAVWYFFFRTSSPAAQPSPNQVTLPFSNNGNVPTTTGDASSSNGLSLTASDGSTIVARDFLQDPETTADPVNNGYYRLGAPSSAPFLATYISETQYFNVELLQEPIGQSRMLAEQYLQQQLGISSADMCKLNYQISTPTRVNTYYGGVDLRFSFCPGATVLPN